MPKEKTDRCTGHCCKNFSLPLGPEEIREAYHRWLATQAGHLTLVTKENTIPGMVWADIHLLAPMLIYLGPNAKRPRFVIPPGKPFRTDHRYRCKHWDPWTKDCTIYDIRPQMCREYPGREGCNFAACTWKSRKRKKLTKAELAAHKVLDDESLKLQEVVEDPGSPYKKRKVRKPE